MKPAEKRLLDACQKGEVLNLGNERPTEKTVDNEIRGEFLRALILSNNQKIEESSKKYILKIDPKGIRFSGVYISGIFDFSFCSTEIPFSFINSVFENEIILNDSKIFTPLERDVTLDYYGITNESGEVEYFRTLAMKYHKSTEGVRQARNRALIKMKKYYGKTLMSLY